MSKRYLHSKDGSRIVEDGSAEMIELLSGGQWFKNKADVAGGVVGAVVTGVAPKDDTTPISELSDEDLVNLYDSVDLEMVNRGLLEAEDTAVVDYDDLTDDALKGMAQTAKIKGFALMKRDTLIEALKGA